MLLLLNSIKDHIQKDAVRENINIALQKLKRSIQLGISCPLTLFFLTIIYHENRIKRFDRLLMWRPILKLDQFILFCLGRAVIVL